MTYSKYSSGFDNGFETSIPIDEAHALSIISMQKWRDREQRQKIREDARKAAIKEKITLPKLKFMGDI